VPADHRLTVAAVIARDEGFLLVEELVDGRLVLNQPAGHVEPGETLLAAVVREVAEETARAFTPDAVVGVYHWQPADGGRPYLRVAFAGSCGEPVPGRPLDTGIVGTTWLERAALAAAPGRLRSPMVLRAIDDHLAGRHAPLATLAGLDGPALLARATRL
jgi:8-oxo-dGTP pyrophosphatase MutT (NUDIX family)